MNQGRDEKYLEKLDQRAVDETSAQWKFIVKFVIVGLLIVGLIVLIADLLR